jgi:hypothetical protein
MSAKPGNLVVTVLVGGRHAWINVAFGRLADSGWTSSHIQEVPGGHIEPRRTIQSLPLYSLAQFRPR